MALASLVEFDLAAGRRVIDALDSRNLEIHVAFWAFLDEYEEWRLFISSPLLDTHNVFEAYRQVILIVRELAPAVSNLLLDIRKMSEPFIADIRQSVGEADYGARFGGQTFGRSYVEDAFVYRIR